MSESIESQHQRYCDYKITEGLPAVDDTDLERFWFGSLIQAGVSHNDFTLLMQYAFDGSSMRIVYTDEIDEGFVYAVVVKDTDFWMDAFKNRDDAITLGTADLFNVLYSALFVSTFLQMKC